MEKGSCRLWLAALAIALGAGRDAGAQNLGLGTGSRSSAPDSAQDARSGWNEEGSAPRRSQMNKRLGLSARRALAFDPKIYEARGRELQGLFYEIGGPAEGRRDLPVRTPAGGFPAGELAAQRKGRTQWMVWAGVAGLAGASAGAVGWLLLQKSHPTAPPPKELLITDEPP
jgi:hypothetical protein